MGEGIEETEVKVRDELWDALCEYSGVLGEVAARLRERDYSNDELVAEGAAANAGAASNARAAISAIVDGKTPRAPSVAQKVGTNVRTLLKNNYDLSERAHARLTGLLADLDLTSHDPVAIESEDAAAKIESERLRKVLQKEPGVYVYTLPSFRRVPILENPDRFWFKVGYSDVGAASRVFPLAARTGLPEAPEIRRVYQHSVMDNRALEKVFHSLLEAAGHDSSKEPHTGKEWFRTNLTYLDAIAKELGCHILGEHWVYVDDSRNAE